jgi:hypothetical protein
MRFCFDSSSSNDYSNSGISISTVIANAIEFINHDIPWILLMEEEADEW